MSIQNPGRSDDDHLEFALNYAKLVGWRVFPLHYPIDSSSCSCGKQECSNVGKHPRTQNGFKNATTDQDQIRKWWGRLPAANIGIATGGESNLVVLDVDPRHGGDESLEELEQKYGPLPETAVVTTGGGGRHFYFAHPGESVRNSEGTLGPGLDIRGDGGYVVAPPSAHKSGGSYLWLGDAPAANIVLAALPGWISQLNGCRRSKRESSPDLSWIAGNSKAIPEGQRNSTLASVAGSLRRQNLGPAAIEAALADVNQRLCVPPLSPAEVSRIAGSISKYNATDPPPRASAPRPVLLRVADVEPQPVEWLWEKRIPRGKLTSLVGNPGVAKSFLTLDITARVSSGRDFPDGSISPGPGSVILLSAEDDVADTIRPRLDAAHADVNRIVFLEAVEEKSGKQRGFDLARDMAALESACQQLGDLMLIVIDPISAFLGETDSHRNSDVRGLLAELARLAAKYNVAVIAVSHLRKSGGMAVYRTSGSLAFTAAPRAVWAIGKDRDDDARRLMMPIKMNLAADSSGLAFRIRGAGSAAYVEWEPDPVHGDVEDLLGDQKERKEKSQDHSRMEEAKQFLRIELGDGPLASTELRKRATAAGVSKKTLDRAREVMGVKATRVKDRWICTLPPDFFDAPKKNVFGDLRRNGAETPEFPAIAEDRQEGVDDLKVDTQGPPTVGGEDRQAGDDDLGVNAPEQPATGGSMEDRHTDNNLAQGDGHLVDCEVPR